MRNTQRCNINVINIRQDAQFFIKKFILRNYIGHHCFLVTERHITYFVKETTDASLVAVKGSILKM